MDDQIYNNLWIFMVWVYIINGLFIITHRIDSLFWRKWEWFHLPGRRVFFFALDYIILCVILGGMYPLTHQKTSGIYVAILSSIFGYIIYFITIWLIKQGIYKLSFPINIFYRYATLFLSTLLLIIALILLFFNYLSP